MKALAISVVIIISITVGSWFICVAIENGRIDNTQNTELEIAEVVNTVSGNCHKEYTILIVYEENGDKYKFSNSEKTAVSSRDEIISKKYYNIII